MVLCYRCKERPIPAGNLKHGHFRCHRCHAEQYRVSRARADRKYHAAHKEEHLQRQRRYLARRINVAGTSVTFPTVELKEQAAALIAQRRYEFVERQSAGTQTESPTPCRVPPEAEL